MGSVATEINSYNGKIVDCLPGVPAKLIINGMDAPGYLFAILTDPTYYYLHLFLLKTHRKFYIRNIYIIQADSGAAIFAEKMNVIIVMMSLRTIILTKCITDGVVRGGNSMDDSFFEERMQRAIDRNPVEFFAGLLFNVTMSKRAIVRQKQLENSLPASGYTQLVTLQYVCNLLVHILITVEHCRLLMTAYPAFFSESNLLMSLFNSLISSFFRPS
jgi:hypothetical protein